MRWLRHRLVLVVVTSALAGCQAAGPAATTPRPASTTAPPATTAVASPSAAVTTAPASSSAPATADTEALAQLYEAAKAEGQIVRWGGEDPAQMETIFAAFSADYPGLTISESQINPNDSPQRILTETAAGQPPPDLFQGQFQFNEPLAGQLTADPGWADYGVPAEIIRPDGGIATLYSPYVLAFNTSLITKAELPTSWVGLADAKYAGKLSVDPRAFPFSLLAPKLGDSVVLDLVQDLKTTVKPKIVQGSTAGLTGLVAGEYSLRPALLEDVNFQKSKGAPVDFVVLEPAPVQISAWYIPSKAVHPNAAKLYAIWFATKGQAITLAETFKSNVPPKEIPASVFYEATTAEEFAAISAITPKIADIWGAP